MCINNYNLGFANEHNISLFLAKTRCRKTSMNRSYKFLAAIEITYIACSYKFPTWPSHSGHLVPYGQSKHPVPQLQLSQVVLQSKSSLTHSAMKSCLPPPPIVFRPGIYLYHIMLCIQDGYSNPSIIMSLLYWRRHQVTCKSSAVCKKEQKW